MSLRKMAAFIAVVGSLMVVAPAMALPGDPAVSSTSPVFRLNTNTLEPGCFVPRRNAPVDVDSHLVFGVDSITGEAHITVSDGAPFSIDQVLAPSPVDGYRVVNTFDTGTVNNDPDIDPGQTATGITSPTRFVDTGDLIVCISAHGDDAQNEPYNQENGGLVSAINRPIVSPHVTALGSSALTAINSYKIGFGYSSDQWYTRPSFETTEDGNGLFPAVTDPNGFPSPTFGDNLPAFVDMFPRPADFPYDARRVNDVDKNGEHWAFPTPADGQTFLFRQAGDSTAWTDSNGNGLLTTLTQGDLPISWTVRPSLAAPSSERSVTFTDDMLRAWNASWQAYYQGKGAKPSLALPPGTNSPAIETGPGVVIVNPQLVVPASGGPAVPVTVNVTQNKLKLAGNTVRTLHVSKRSGFKLVSARATLRGARLHVSGRTITVNLTSRTAGNYNVMITAKYKSLRTGKTRTVHYSRNLSVRLVAAT